MKNIVENSLIIIGFLFWVIVLFSGSTSFVFAVGFIIGFILIIVGFMMKNERIKKYMEFT